MLKRFLHTNDDALLLVQRVALGVVMFPHGAQKLFGWFGGFGFQGTMGYLTGHVHLPAAIAVLVILAESLGSIGLVLGAGTRLAALGVSAVMLGAVLTTHVGHGFFMNWGGTQGGEGFEYHILALALSLPLVVLGAGRASVDRFLARRLESGSHDASARPLAHA